MNKNLLAGLAVLLPLLAAPSLVLAAASSVYTAGTTGYDISYNISESSYPAVPFGFGIVGVSGGKAFKHNLNLGPEFTWASQGTSPTPTLYMNLNAPVGKTAKPYTSTPTPCPNGKNASLCQAHNYGWNAAADAYEYATSVGAASPTWWLDIETANSWSGTQAINQQTIQGAIDFLNTQGVTVGVYSTSGMWSTIAGSYSPTNAGGSVVPTWQASGLTTATAAQAKCGTSFISGSTNWLVQFINSAVSSLDQDLAC